MDVEKSLDERISDRKGSRPAAPRAPRPSRPASTNATPYAVRLWKRICIKLPTFNTSDRLHTSSDLLRNRRTAPGLMTCSTREEEADPQVVPVTDLVLPRAGRLGC